MFALFKKTTLVAADEALSGRETRMPVPEHHAVNGRPLMGPWPAELKEVMFGMGCFWGG